MSLGASKELDTTSKHHQRGHSQSKDFANFGELLRGA